ncbi:hypothetical protein ANN_23941 [Periplaneta americana]|uniref:Uncharacterized protein n=1 Tax=Periplaneta americana TaxID=6978 RepID=A0ABQ8S1Q0_PERAM|nr:hypothetical protein ANN_23941 [Periplaneta americana]
MDLREVGYDDRDWINLAQDRDRWRAYLQHYVKSLFTTNRAAVVGAGIQQEDLVCFAQNLALESGAGPADIATKYSGGEQRIDAAGSLAHVAVAVEGASLKNTKEALAFAVLQYALGTGPAVKWGASAGSLARAVNAAVASEPVAVTAFNASYTDSGLFGFVASSPGKVAGQVLETALKQLRSGNLSSGDITRGKNQLKAAILLCDESNASLVEEIGVQAVLLGNVLSSSAIASAVDSVTDAEVNAQEDRDITYALFCSVPCIMEQVLFDEILILSVEENPHVYDKQRDSYKDEKMKENTWLSIAASLNTDFDKPLLNQKQISSWSSKEKLSSPVIYDELGNQYIAVFNRNQLRIWSESEDNLDKIKKFKFQQHIHCVMSQLSGREPLIIFSNGATCLLSAALESRKIEIDLSRDVSSVKVKVERENFQLMGQTTIQQDSSYNLLTLWSDGKLFSLTFLPEVDSKLPGTLVNIVRAVSTKHPVAMTNLSASHVAIYGADPSEEGASLIIYNVQFGVVQSRHHLKLFASPPRLWCTGTNLLITTAHNLVVVPYQLETQRLSSLIGAHCSNVSQSEKDYDLQEMCQMDVNWITNGSDEQAQSETEQMPDTLKQQLQTLQDNGYPQSMMVQKLLPDLLETKSVTELHWCIKYFTDIPENSLVQMLQFCLDNGVDNSERGPYSELLIAILHTTFNDVCLLPYLRAIPFSQAMTLLQYLCDEFDTDGSNVELSNVIDWTSLLLDAHYQRFVLSGDPQVQTLLCKLRELVHSQLVIFSEIILNTERDEGTSSEVKKAVESLLLKLQSTKVKISFMNILLKIVRGLENEGQSLIQKVLDEGQSLMLAGSEFQSLGRAIVKEDEYEEYTLGVPIQSQSFYCSIYIPD